MNQPLLTCARVWFDRHVDEHRTTPGGELHAMLELKRTHSLRVAADCRELARDLGWSPADLDLAETIGLLHDIGRFQQFTHYRTFADRKSVDHGECGYEWILQTDLLSGAAPQDRQAVLDGIRFHNRREIPPDLPAVSVHFLRLVRDADKLDIMYVINDAIRNNRIQEHPEMLLNVAPDAPPTPELLRQLRAGRIGSYEHVHSLADMNLMRVSWVYDINYPPALARIASRGLFTDLQAMLPRHPDIAAILAEANAFLAAQLTAQPSSRPDQPVDGVRA